MDQGADTAAAQLPIGRSGRLQAVALSAGPDHAVLVREPGEDRPRALLTTDKLPTGERLVIMPLDDEVDVRVDGDALAVWIASGRPLSDGPAPASRPTESAPAWSVVVGGALLLTMVALAVLGSLTFFGWLAGVLS